MMPSAWPGRTSTGILHDSQEADAPGFDALLEYLKRTRGFDFSAYKRQSLMRRMQKRLQMIGVESFLAYADYVEVHPDEFEQLFNAILINVTAFFRDEQSSIASCT